MIPTLAHNSTPVSAERDSQYHAAYVGIDVAIAKTKRLPMCVVVHHQGRLEPLPLRRSAKLKPPRGPGNRRVIEPSGVQTFAEEALAYLRAVERSYGVTIEQVAIDAPSSPKRHGIPRREAELAMDQRRISCFATPSSAEFDDVIARVRAHLAAGGDEGRIPHANQLWMIAGFALFDALAAVYHCIEVFPNAIVRAIGAGSLHKSTTAGLADQLQAVSVRTGWQPSELFIALRQAGWGSPHDRLDAYLSGWVASLPASQVEMCGVPGDAIVVPRAVR